ncbi:MAG TPA: hypothetical protein VGQ56_06870 [Gemmatimonadaceae bacterium]|jgi:hypothetical protein|nr:hypothetical protein [Gemmatimonadaceae bacterium]
MRVGDFAVDVVAHGSGRVEERESGHVLARAGQVYRLRLRNFGPLYCVVEVNIDGRGVTAGGLVLEPWGTTELERPIHAEEDGRFTVVAEGDERVFGPDGGRDNAALGLIEARFRRELPQDNQRRDLPSLPSVRNATRPLPGQEVPRPPHRYSSPPIPSAFRGIVQAPSPHVPDYDHDGIERAAGTGLTGHSDQRFVPIALGPLEPDATVIQLRLVIATEAALADAAARPLTDRVAPARPAPRP